MKGKRSISFLITGMVALTNILGSASTVFAKESTIMKLQQVIMKLRI